MKNRPNSELNQLCQVPLLADLLELPELLLQSDLGDLGSRRAGKLYRARSRGCIEADLCKEMLI